MTISTTLSRRDYIGNGVTTVFAVDFPFFGLDDLIVIQRVIATGAETTLARGTHYSVTGGNGSTGTVTAVTAPAATVQWTILRRTPRTQETDYVDYDAFPAEAHERALDRLTAIAQEVEQSTTRSLRVAASDPVQTVLPGAAERANRLVGFDAAGNFIATPGFSIDGVVVSTFMATLLDDADEVAACATLGLSAGGGANRVGFTQGGAGAIERTAQAKLREQAATPFDFMDAAMQTKVALRTATAADAPAISAAIAAAMAAHDTVEFPEGLYQTNAPVALTRTRQAITGRGSRLVEIRINSTTAKAVTLASGVADYTVRGFKVTRAGTPVSGANGVECLGTTDNTLLEDLWCEGHWTGMIIGTCDTGRIQNIRCNKNLQDGLYQTNASTYGPSQWEMFDLLLDRNARDGWRVQTTAGPAGLILGNTTSIKTFANSGYGCNFIGSSTTPIFDVRLEQAFLGSDGLGSVRLNTFGGKHRLCGFFERNGRDPTGPTLATPASNNGAGIEITANNIDVVVYGSTIDDNALDGIIHDGGVLIVTGNMIFNNGQALTGGRRNGVLSQGGELVMTGNGVNNLGGNTSQLFGVAASHDDVVINGNSLKNNTSGGASAGGTADAIVFANSPTSQPMLLAPTLQVLRFNSAFDPAATGGDKGVGTVNVSGNLFKNNVAYNNP